MNMSKTCFLLEPYPLEPYPGYLELHIDMFEDNQCEVLQKSLQCASAPVAVAVGPVSAPPSQITRTPLVPQKGILIL